MQTELLACKCASPAAKLLDEKPKVIDSVRRNWQIYRIRQRLNKEIHLVPSILYFTRETQRHESLPSFPASHCGAQLSSHTITSCAIDKVSSRRHDIHIACVPLWRPSRHSFVQTHTITLWACGQTFRREVRVFACRVSNHRTSGRVQSR